jgi:hypothetical protein
LYTKIGFKQAYPQQLATLVPGNVIPALVAETKVVT